MTDSSRVAKIIVPAMALVGLLLGCSSDSSESSPAGSPGAGGNAQDAGPDVPSADASTDVQADQDAGPVQDAPDEPSVPTTCEQARTNPSSFGCEFWPTVVANNVWSTFDFAVVVSNPGKKAAQVHVTGPRRFSVDETVPAGQSKVVYLPWVAKLKGDDWDWCAQVVAMEGSVLVPRGAFHLTSSVPVSVVQFNPIEYEGKGGPNGKDWSKCPGNEVCAQYGKAAGCFAFSTDASLLLPSSLLGKEYRVIAPPAWTEKDGYGLNPPLFVITATQDDTEIELTSAGVVQSGGGLSALIPGQKASLRLNAGDVIEVVGRMEAGNDLSGTTLRSTKPIQVISGMACREVPADHPTCDHLEETVLPVGSVASLSGSEYVVVPPLKPKTQKAAGHWVRFVGHAGGTVLHFDPPGSLGNTAKLDEGKVLDMGIVTQAFRVWSEDEKPFSVVTFQQGGSVVNPDDGSRKNGWGDPSQSVVIPRQAWGKTHVFQAPEGYLEHHADVIGPVDASISLDGTQVTATHFEKIGSSGLGVMHLVLSKAGAHRIDASVPVTIQVYGYGEYTSYQYPSLVGSGK